VKAIMESLMESAKCCVCFECTSETPKQLERRLFGCGHSICRHCLDTMIENMYKSDYVPDDDELDEWGEPGWVIRCPTCRHVEYVDPDLNSFVRNFALESVVKAIGEMQKSTSGSSEDRLVSQSTGADAGGNRASADLASGGREGGGRSSGVGFPWLPDTDNAETAGALLAYVDESSARIANLWIKFSLKRQEQYRLGMWMGLMVSFLHHRVVLRKVELNRILNDWYDNKPESDD